MERFSNNSEDYWNQIKSELLDSGNSEDVRFRYLEIGQLLSHGFSITQFDTYPEELIFKVWDAQFDNSRFNKGIYNLDRLAINNKKVELNLEEGNKIKGLLNKKLNLINCNGIVLDGLFCQIEIGNLKLNWNTNEEMNSSLSKLVEFLRSTADKTIW